jgi:methanogenic corrinoid protein MtbC1/DNA-binding XRE family transcriptional regulator
MATSRLTIDERVVAEYLTAALAGDERWTALIVNEARTAGAPTADIYLQLFVPAQRELGFRWSRGEISVANEHLATEITSRLMVRLRDDSYRKPSLGVKAAVAAAPLEHHAMGAQIVADFLYLDGWEVDFLGADLPATELAGFARSTRLDLIALSVVLTGGLATVRDAVEQAKAAAPEAKVMIGGAAIADEGEALRLGAHGFAADAQGAIETARELVGLARGVSLDQLLATLGERIQLLRRTRGWNQQQIADLAGLDRTYISTVENGKQNLTLSALHKLAAALEVPPGSLLSPSGE